MRDLEIDAAIDESLGAHRPSPPSRALGDGLARTGPRSARCSPCAGVRAAATARWSLDGGTAGYDYTHGLLPRHTKWRWAFALGKARPGEPFGFNVVQGFVGEAECAAFVSGDDVVPLAEPRFEFDVDAADAPVAHSWATGSISRSSPAALHAQNTNLVVVKSRFVQPVGTFTGTVRVAGATCASQGLPGVVEDQDVLW